MTGSLQSPRAKIEWAKRHIHELEAVVNGLVISHESHPHVIVTEDDPQTGNLLYKLAGTPQVPDRVGLLAADAIHNMRVALDRLMTQLVERAGNMPKNRRTPYFPTGKDRQSFESFCTAQIQALIGQDAFDVLRATDAYLGGKGEVVWYLHHLDIEDKHRIDYALGFNMSSLTLSAPTIDMSEVAEHSPELAANFNRMVGEAMSKLFWKPADILFPLQDGDTLFSGPQNPTNDPQFRLEVAFSEPEIVHAKPVLPTLIEYAQATEALIESFAPLF